MKIKSDKYYDHLLMISTEPIMIKVDYENDPSRDVPIRPNKY